MDIHGYKCYMDIKYENKVCHFYHTPVINLFKLYEEQSNASLRALIIKLVIFKKKEITIGIEVHEV